MENDIYQSHHTLQLAFECVYGKPRERRFTFSFGNHYREWGCVLGMGQSSQVATERLLRYNSGVECLSNSCSISSTFSRDNCSTLQLWGQKFKIGLSCLSVCLDRWGLVNSEPLRGQSVSLPWDVILPTPTKCIDSGLHPAVSITLSFLPSLAATYGSSQNL